MILKIPSLKPFTPFTPAERSMFGRRRRNLLSFWEAAIFSGAFAVSFREGLFPQTIEGKYIGLNNDKLQFQLKSLLVSGSLVHLDHKTSKQTVPIREPSKKSIQSPENCEKERSRHI